MKSFGRGMPEEVSNAFLGGLESKSAVMQTFTHVPVSRAQTRFPVLSALPVAYWVTGDTGLKQTSEKDLFDITSAIFRSENSGNKTVVEFRKRLLEKQKSA